MAARGGARPRTLVLGAGCFGLAAALELCARGHAVTVLEAGPIPAPRAASSDVSKLVRADYGADRWYAERALDAMAAWRSWNARFDRPLYHETGLLVLRRGSLAPESFEAHSAATLSRLGCPLEPLEPHVLTRRHPAWRPAEPCHGYRNPWGGWVESGEVIRAWAAAAARAGASLRPHTEVVAIEPPANVRTRDGSRLSADYVVVALGAHTARLLPALADQLRPIAQPVVHLRPSEPHTLRPPHFLPWAFDIARTGWYGFPATAAGVVKIGHHGAGSPVDPAAYDDTALPAGHLERLRAFLEQVLPELADAPVAATRICLYCDTPEGDFRIAALAHAPRVTVAAGGSGHAFKFAPLVGAWIADALEGQANPALERFRWRTPPDAPTAREAARSA